MVKIETHLGDIEISQEFFFYFLGIDEDDIAVYDETPPNYCEKCGQALDWSDHPTEKGGEADA